MQTYVQPIKDAAIINATKTLFWVQKATGKWIKNNGFAFSYTFDNYAKKDDYNLVKLVEKVYNNINHSARLYYTGTFGQHTFNAGVEAVHESLRHYMMKDTGYGE